MKVSDIRYKCDHCSVRSCGIRNKHYNNGKELTGIVVGCSEWKPTNEAKRLLDSIINPTIFSL